MAVTIKVSDEDPIPDSESFDLNEYLDESSNFPIVKHTVFPGQELGMELVSVDEEIKKLEDEENSLRRSLGAISSRSSSSFVDDRAEAINDRLEEISESLSEKREEQKNLEKAISKKALILNIQVRTSKELGRVVHKAEKEYVKKNGKGSDNNPEYITGKAEYVLIAQLDAFCVKIENPKGQSSEPPGREWFSTLLDRLIPSETLRLFNAVNKAMSSTQTWASRLDAGFLGGSSDLELGTLDGSGPADGAGLENSTSHASDG